MTAVVLSIGGILTPCASAQSQTKSAAPKTIAKSIALKWEMRGFIVGWMYVDPNGSTHFTSEWTPFLKDPIPAISPGPDLVEKDLKELVAAPDVAFGFDLSFCGKVSDEGLKRIAGFKRLKYLDLHLTGITNQGLKNLTNLKRLTHLDLGRTRVSDDGLQHLAGLSQLTSLHFGPKVTDQGLKHLAPFKNLTHLTLSSKKVTDRGIKMLPRFKALTTLSLEGTGIADAGIAELVKISKLNTLDLSGTRLSDQSVKYIARLKGLRHLDLTFSGVTDSGIDKLRKRLPKCTIKASPF